MRGIAVVFALSAVALSVAVNLKADDLQHNQLGGYDVHQPSSHSATLQDSVDLGEGEEVKVGGEIDCGDGYATTSFTDASHITTTTCTAPVQLDCPLNTKKSVMVDDLENANKQVTFKCENCNPGTEAPEGCELMFACTDAHCENYCKYSSGLDGTCRACPKDYTWKVSVNDTLAYGRIRGHDPCRRSCNECAGKDGTDYYGYCIWVAAHNHMMVKAGKKSKKLRNPDASDDEDCAVESGDANNNRL